jgi:thioredoxin-like negative regulator of GroEL
MDQQPDLDSSHHESDLSVQTRIQGHEKSLEANPNDLASRMGLAQAHMHGENWMEAAEHLDKVVNDDPKNPKAPPLLARCYLSMGHMDKGERYLHVPPQYARSWPTYLACRCVAISLQRTRCFRKP